MNRYIAVIRKDANTCYGVDFPDFPGCISAGDTMEEALANAREALALVLDEMAKDGKAPPAPSDLDTVQRDRHNRGGLAVLIDAPEAVGKAVPITATIDEFLLKRIDRVAKNRSQFLADAARAELARRGA